MSYQVTSGNTTSYHCYATIAVKAVLTLLWIVFIALVPAGEHFMTGVRQEEVMLPV